jgi:hypothetical protein
MSEQEQPIVIINADAYWANLTTQNDLSGKFQLDLCNLSDAAVEKLQSIGLQVKNRDDKPEQGSFITPKSNNTIKYYDTSGDDITGVLVGNGSKVKAVISAYDWTFQNRKGRSPSLKKLVITELVEFAPETDGGASSYDLDEAL